MFNPSIPPENAYSIILCSWTHSTIPCLWIETLKAADKIWIPSGYNKICLNDIVNEERISVIPVGIDRNIFNNHPVIQNETFCTSKKIKFLFVGDINWHKGVDSVLQAYTDEFSPDESVCLIIKGTSKNQDKYTQEILNKISFYQSCDNRPEIIYIPDELDENKLAGLYKECSCLVYPYRTESSLVPVLESMFCETPVITTGFGPSIEFCNNKNSYLLKSNQIRADINKIDDMETISKPVFAEIDIPELRQIMRQIYENYNVAKEKAKIAYEEIVPKYDIENTITMILEELEKIPQKTIYRIVKQKYQDLLFQGYNALEKNDFLGAIANFNNILEQDPKDSFARLGLGSTYVDLKEYDKALEQLALSIKTHPYNLQAYQLMAITLFNLGEKELSLMFFKKFAELKPDEPLMAERISAISKLIAASPEPEMTKISKYEQYKELIS